VASYGFFTAIAVAYTGICVALRKKKPAWKATRVSLDASRMPRRLLREADAGQAYLSEDEMFVKLVLSAVPNPFTTAMIASEMPAAIKPYSIAVAPD